MMGYIDPGLGLLAWQAVVAFFIGLLFYLKRTRDWITQTFRKILRLTKRPASSPAKIAPPSDALRQ